MTRPMLLTAIVAETAIAAFLLATGRATIAPHGAFAIADPLAGAAAGAALALALLAVGGVPARLSGRLADRVIGTIFQSAFEEILWRGFLLRAFSASYGGATGFILATVAFAIAHASQGWSALGVHLLTGALFGGVFVLSHDLLAAICAHVAYNVTLLVRMQVRCTHAA